MNHPPVPVDHPRFKFYKPTGNFSKKQEWCYVTALRYGSEFHSIARLDEDEDDQLRQDCANAAACYWFMKVEDTGDKAFQNAYAWLAWGRSYLGPILERGEKMITEKQYDIICHACANELSDKRYREYYAVYDDCAEVPALKDLEAKGFARSRRMDALASAMTYYYITNEGVNAAIAFEAKKPDTPTV